MPLIPGYLALKAWPDAPDALLLAAPPDSTGASLSDFVHFRSPNSAKAPGGSRLPRNGQGFSDKSTRWSLGNGCATKALNIELQVRRVSHVEESFASKAAGKLRFAKPKFR
jgi:hypothetical protein